MKINIINIYLFIDFFLMLPTTYDSMQKRHEDNLLSPGARLDVNGWIIIVITQISN